MADNCPTRLLPVKILSLDTEKSVDGEVFPVVQSISRSTELWLNNRYTCKIMKPIVCCLPLVWKHCRFSKRPYNIGNWTKIFKNKLWIS